MLLERGEIHNLAGNLEAAEVDHQSALLLFTQAREARGIAQAQTCLAGVLQLQGRCDEALDLLEDALRIRRRERDFRGQISTLRCISVTEWALGNLQEAHKHLQQAITIAGDLQDINRLAPTMLNMSTLLTELDQFEKAKTILRDAEQLYKRLGNTVHRSLLLVNLAQIYIDIGELDDAWEAIEDSLSVADPNTWLRVTAFAHTLAADIWLRRQRPRRARRRIRRAADICTQINDPYVVAMCASVQGRVLGLLGDAAAAADQLHRAEELFDTALEGVSLGRALVRLGNAWADLDALAQARTFIDKAQTLLLGNPQENVRLVRELDELRQRLQPAS